MNVNETKLALAKAEELRLISKELRWLSKHYRRLYEIEMTEQGLTPKQDEDANQLKLFSE